MSILIYIFKAWIIGIAIAAPVGPIGMLCIKKTLEIGIKGALLVGLGAALADGTYGLIAALGLTALSNVMLANASVFKIIGGSFLLYLSYQEINNLKKPNNKQMTHPKNSFNFVITVFFLTIINPVTIFTFFGFFTSIGIQSYSISQSILMGFGIFLGSMTWWCILGIIIAKIKHKLPKIWIKRINWISSAILASFGLIAILSSLMG